ncbi:MULTISPECIES: hypothetical protein [unclassified Bradyrhizobium]
MALRHPGRDTRRGFQAWAARHRGPECRALWRGPLVQRACWILEVCKTISFAFVIRFGIAEAAVEVRATPPSAAKTTAAIFSLMDDLLP